MTMEKDSYQLLIDHALKLLSYRPRTKREITGKLQQMAIKMGISETIFSKVISDLEKRNLVNDMEFGKWWISQRATFRPKGEKLIKIELRQKGINKDIISDLLTEKDPQLPSDYELALSLAQKRMPRLQTLPKEKIKEKVAGLLIRRGFTWEITHSVIDTLMKKE